MDCLSDRDMETLKGICSGGVIRGVDLSALSHWRIGGSADLLLRPASTAEVIALRRWFFSRDIPHMVIGNTTNLLFADEGLRVPCLQIGQALSGVGIEGEEVFAGAGAWVPGLARTLMLHSLSGGEHMSGVPGALGGLICMNGGSNGRSVGDNVVSVESVDAQGLRINREVLECGFDYRRSVFQTNGEIITSVHLRFLPGDQKAIRAEMLADLASRRKKFPLKEPSCGSVFKRNAAMYADIGPPGAVIERLGFKGMCVGGAMVSPKHANFIVNTGHAKAADILEMISRIRDTVFAQTGYRLHTEACYVTLDGSVQPVDHVL